MDILLIGHRTSGKTTLARALSLLHPHLFDVIDLDALIEREEERTCAEIIADHEPYFRELERAYLDKVLAEPSDAPHRIIVPGAGCQHLPHGPLYIWLWRDGWEDTARTQRARLRRRRSFAEEVAWMRQQREPLWKSRAHAIHRIARGSQREHDIRRLSELVLAMLQAPKSATMQKSWLVPHDEVTLERAIADLPTLGCAGIEARSDFFPEHVDQLAMHMPVLASLRTENQPWLEATAPHAAAFDVDITLMHVLDNSNILTTVSPRPLILSAHPEPSTPHEDVIAHLTAHARQLTDAHPTWAEHLILKYAPHHDSADEVLQTLDAMQELADTFTITYLPQGPKFAWMRPWLVAHMNATNYLPVMLNEHTLSLSDEQTHSSPAALDLHEWLPHLTSSPPTRFDALIGDPVHQSMGDWWHRMASLRAEQPELGYLKIPVKRDLKDGAWRHMLSLFKALDLRGISITSPHKRVLIAHKLITLAEDRPMEAVNTLKHHDEQGWLGIDTDHVGMIATLDELVTQGIEPGTVAIMGQGGVSPAVLRAFEARKDWQLVHHASAREGWKAQAPPEQVTLVVNAAGDHDAAYQDAPRCEAWVDLHYRHVRTPPSGSVHLNGEVFFEAQASAQRRFWS